MKLLKTLAGSYEPMNNDQVDTIVYSNKPKFAVSKIVINDSNDVYVQNGSEFFRVDFVHQVYDIITNTRGNQGWEDITENAKSYFIEVMEELTQKSHLDKYIYLGLDSNNEIDAKFIAGKPVL